MGYRSTTRGSKIRNTPRPLLVDDFISLVGGSVGSSATWPVEQQAKFDRVYRALSRLDEEEQLNG